MSRFSKENIKYSFVFGLDRATGPFFQVWQQPAEDMEVPVVQADRMGIRADLQQAAAMNRRLARLFQHTDERFQMAREMGNLYPNLDAGTINDFAEACGIEGLYEEIAAALDREP